MEIHSAKLRRERPAIGDRAASFERLLSVGSRVFVWGLFFGTLYLLRSFFLLLFLTFVFSYIQSHGVNRLQRHVENRSLAVSMVGVSFLLVLVGIGWFLIPQVIQQAKLVADRHDSYLHTLDQEVIDLAQKFPVLGNFLSELGDPVASTEGDVYAESMQVTSLEATRRVEKYDPSKSLSLGVMQQLAGFDEEAASSSNLTHLVEITRNIGQPLLAIGSAFFLSLLFSFLIILDLPRLTESIQSLGNSKIAFIFEEVAPSITSFAAVLGRAFQAQLLIALVNTALTAGIIYVLGLQKSVAFLSLIVFICGFVPVAGVFISSVPILLMALQNSGLQSVLLAVALIWLVHVIEAYVLNPRIFGDKLKINPVIVLIILTVAGKLFGVWGLILSLPVYTYVVGYAIRHDDEMPPENQSIPESKGHNGRNENLDPTPV